VISRGETAARQGRPGRSDARGLRALRLRWKEALAPMRKRMHAHYPVLFEHAEALWLAEIEAFLSYDLDRLAREGRRFKGTEVVFEAEVPLARGAALLRAEKIRSTSSRLRPRACLSCRSSECSTASSRASGSCS